MPHTLLLADDSVTIQRVIELTFADEDVQVVAVSDGDQAIAAIDRTPPDIVLVDVGMPGRSGYEVARHIKETPHLAHIPVVLLTGAFEPIDQAQAEAVGCDGVLAKPFEPQLVIGRVKELLSKPKPASQDSRVAPPPAASWAPAATETDVPRAPVQPSTDDYFETLDRAFASLSASGPTERPQPASTPAADAIDWFGLKPPTTTEASGVPDTWDVPAPPSAVDLPLSYGSAQADFDRSGALEQPIVAPPPLVPEAAWTSAPPVPPVPTAPVVLPQLADAFAALLRAEQGLPSPPAAPGWPAASQPAAITDDLVDQVTRRVLERLSDRAVREMVADIVTGIAERLVRDEIERIKNAIR